MGRRLLAGIGLALASAALIPASSPAQVQTVSLPRAREPILPIPPTPSGQPEKVALGKRLFHEPKLSRDDSMSCASCHSLTTAGVDRRPRPVGVGGVSGDVNTPTVFNSAFNFRQFWDGRAESLEEQIGGPMENPKEMATTWSAVLEKLRQSPDYLKAFSTIYADGITQANVRDAIATYERTLTTPNSRFDRFLRGDPDAISADEKDGYEIFKSYGCVTCHQGVGVGGNMFQSFGVMADYFADRGDVRPPDFGRFNVTGREEDRFVFKVPQLRLAVLTPPYFHDGSAKTIEDAVTVMGRYQLGRTLSADERRLIVAFLKSLPGEYAGQPLL